jgi:chromosome segregation ATPase
MGQTTVAGYSNAQVYATDNQTNRAGKSVTSGAGEASGSSQTDQSGTGVSYDVSQGASRVAALIKDATFFGDEDTSPEETAETEETSEKKASGYTQEDVDEMERLLQRMQESSSSGTSTTSTKKKLSYSYKKVSSAIMRSKTRMQANSALRSAKSSLVDLKRKAASGQYSDDELEIAITHASKMIRAARKKVSNLEQEQDQDKSDRDTEHSKERDNTSVRQKHVRKEDFQEVDASLDQELQRLKKQLKQLSKMEKNEHRRSENYDLLMADMEYLKRKIDLMRQDNSSGQTTGQSYDSQSVAAVTETAVTAESDSASVAEESASTTAASAGGDVAGTSIDVSV